MVSKRSARVCALAIIVLVSPAALEAASLSVAWDPNTEGDLAGYLVRYGTQAGAYTTVVDVGTQTSVAIQDLTQGQRYYFVVQAYTSAGLTSNMSAEVSDVAWSTAASGLVAAFGFEETQGTIVIDASPTLNNGTITGATRTANGKYGRALTFDGVNDWVTVADTGTLDLTTGMTLAAWVNPTALSGWRTAVIKERPDGISYALYANDNTPNPSVIVNAGGDVSASGTTSLPLNTWTHVAATYDGANLRLFVNGTVVDTRPVSGSIVTSSGPLRIGGNAIWGEYFSGKIDEVRIYNRAVSASEIANDMNIAVVTGLVAAYGFEETTGTVADDASGIGNTGTLSGATRTASGKYGRALSFDGVNDVVTVADAASLDSPHVTVEAWVYPTALSGWRTAVIKEKPAGMVYGLYAHDNVPNPALTVAISGVDHSASGTTPLALNTWSHLAATYDGVTARLFVNGVQVGSNAEAGTLPASADPLRIGGNSVWGEYFSGKIDEVRVYNRALSAAEIQTDMNLRVAP